MIEAGFPITSPGDFEAVQSIAREVTEPAGVGGLPIIAGLARTHVGDIDAAWEAVRDAERPRIHTFISTSDIHIVHQLQSTREDVKGQARAAVAHAKQYLDDVEFSPMDATRADVDFTAEVVQIAIDEGATTINIPDTVGYVMPHEFQAYLARLYELVPGLRDVVLSVHCHDDLGLAVANSFAGVLAGARQVECAVNGIGERAGNASLEEIVMLLRTRRADIGLDTRVTTQELARTSRLVSRLTGYAVQPNKAIVGRNAFAHESGIHQDGVLKERSTYEIMDATTVGLANNSIVLGKHSGRHALRDALEELGFKVEGQTLNTAFKRFKEIADKKKTLTAMDLEALVTEELRDEERHGLRPGVVRGRGLLPPPAARARRRRASRRHGRRGRLHGRWADRRRAGRDQRGDRDRAHAARLQDRGRHRGPGRARRGLDGRRDRRLQRRRAGGLDRRHRGRRAGLRARAVGRAGTRRAARGRVGAAGDGAVGTRHRARATAPVG